jgi:hypothetical protein
MIPIDSERFKAIVTVAVSRQFLGWLIALGDGIRITGPDAVVAQMKEEAVRLANQYA